MKCLKDKLSFSSISHACSLFCFAIYDDFKWIPIVSMAACIEY